MKKENIKRNMAILQIGTALVMATLLISSSLLFGDKDYWMYIFGGIVIFSSIQVSVISRLTQLLLKKQDETVCKKWYL